MISQAQCVQLTSTSYENGLNSPSKRKRPIRKRPVRPRSTSPYISTRHTARVFSPRSAPPLLDPQHPSSRRRRRRYPLRPTPPRPWWALLNESTSVGLLPMRLLRPRLLYAIFHPSAADHLQEEPPRDLQVPLPWWAPSPFSVPWARPIYSCMQIAIPIRD